MFSSISRSFIQRNGSKSVNRRVRHLGGTSAFKKRAAALEEKAARAHNKALVEKSLKSAQKFAASESGGALGTLEFRVFVEKRGERVSSWHDVPLNYDNETHNLLVEMPKDTDAKMELCMKESNSPIKQDKTKGKPRYITHGKVPWNYGALPQTWENDKKQVPGTGGLVGDGDPLDVIEIGSEALPRGAIVPVRVLGALALIDEGEIDWKLIAIAQCDEQAHKLNDINDVEAVYGGKLEAIRDWYRDYKMADGKPANSYAFNEKLFNRKETLEIVEECHQEWIENKKP